MNYTMYAILCMSIHIWFLSDASRISDVSVPPANSVFLGLGKEITSKTCMYTYIYI